MMKETLGYFLEEVDRLKAAGWMRVEDFMELPFGTIAEDYNGTQWRFAEKFIVSARIQGKGDWTEPNVWPMSMHSSLYRVINAKEPVRRVPTERAAYVTKSSPQRALTQTEKNAARRKRQGRK